jgi:hypothetical protein
MEGGTVQSTGAEFPGQQSDHREPGPLTEPERLEQLLFGVFKGGRDRVDSGEWQSAPRAAKDLAKQGTANAAKDQINSKREGSQKLEIRMRKQEAAWLLLLRSAF